MPYLRMIRSHLPSGSKIFLVTLEQPHLAMSGAEEREIKRQLAAEEIELVAFPYSRFGVKALLKWFVFLPRLIALSYRQNIETIHAWCTPAGGAGYIVSRFKRARLIIDSYEPHAESMVELGAWPQGGLAHRILFALEKWQSRKAFAVIATTEGVRHYAREKYDVCFQRFFVKPASVDLKMFSWASAFDPQLRGQLGLENKLVCVYAGKIGGIYLEKEIFDFFKVAGDYWGDRFRVMLLTNTPAERINQLAAASGLDASIITARFAPFHEVPRYLALGNFALNPVRPIPTKRYCTSLKDGEYLAMGLPIVIPANIGDDSKLIAENNIGAVIEQFSTDGYRAAVNKIDELLRSEPREALAARIRRVAADHRGLANTEKIYAELYG